MKVIIVGSGMGGLACAIACAQEGLEVIILERSAELLPVRYIHADTVIMA